MVGFDQSSVYQYLHVDDVLDSTTSLLHTIFHILGRHHEHQRRDRDAYISVMKENIMEGMLC